MKLNLEKGKQYWYMTEGLLATYVTDNCGGIYAGCADANGTTFTCLKSSLITIEQAQRNLVDEMILCYENIDPYEYADEFNGDDNHLEETKEGLLKLIKEGKALEAFKNWEEEYEDLLEEDEIWIDDIICKLEMLEGKQ